MSTVAPVPASASASASVSTPAPAPAPPHHRYTPQDDLVNKSHYLPLELIDKCMNQPIWVLCKNNVEYSGILRGFDDYVNIVMEEVTEIDYGVKKSDQVLQSILLNGSSIAAMCPNTTPR